MGASPFVGTLKQLVVESVLALDQRASHIFLVSSGKPLPISNLLLAQNHQIPLLFSIQGIMTGCTVH